MDHGAQIDDVFHDRIRLLVLGLSPALVGRKKRSPSMERSSTPSTEAVQRRQTPRQGARTVPVTP